MNVTRIGLVTLVSAAIILAATLACADSAPATEERVSAGLPARCPVPAGAWTYDAILRERDTQYVVKRMLMARIAQETDDDVLSAVRVWALYYEVDEAYALCVAHRESSLNETALGDDGNAVGLWQFWLPTWEMFRKKMKTTTDDMRGDLQESTRTAMWAFANGYARHWAPVKKGLCDAPASGQQAGL